MQKTNRLAKAREGPHPNQLWAWLPHLAHVQREQKCRQRPLASLGSAPGAAPAPSVAFIPSPIWGVCAIAKAKGPGLSPPEGRSTCSARKQNQQARATGDTRAVSRGKRWARRGAASPPRRLSGGSWEAPLEKQRSPTATTDNGHPKETRAEPPEKPLRKDTPRLSPPGTRATATRRPPPFRPLREPRRVSLAPASPPRSRAGSFPQPSPAPPNRLLPSVVGRAFPLLTGGENICRGDRETEREAAPQRGRGGLRGGGAPPPAQGLPR